MSRLTLYLLGPPRVELDGAEIHIGRRKALALLAPYAKPRLPPSATTATSSRSTMQAKPKSRPSRVWCL